VRVLGTLNEYQARLFVAEKALQLGRGGISHLSQLTGMSRVGSLQPLPRNMMNPAWPEGIDFGYG